jgi:predicted acetyltransferase
MSDVTIRSIGPHEYEAFYEASKRAFHGRVDPEGMAIGRPLTEHDRTFVATDGDAIVGTAEACTGRFTVPGGQVDAAGITSVGVAPTHRRRGLNTALMSTLLDQAAERSEPLTYLWASEAAIYGRFGFGAASWCADVEVDTRSTAFVPDVGLEGRVRTLDRDDALGPMREVYDAVAATRPGFRPLDDAWWAAMWAERKSQADEPRFFAVHADADGRPDGYAVYGVKQEWTHGVPQHELHVHSIVTAGATASAGLWRYLFDVDLVATVKAWDLPVDDDVRFIVADPRRLQMRVVDGLWIRVLDVAGSLASRRYPADGRLVLEVHDALRAGASGRYDLAVDGGTAACRRTDDEPDLRCSIAAVGAALLGGTPWSRLAAAGQAAADEDVLRRADAMFSWSPSPWFGLIY